MDKPLIDPADCPRRKDFDRSEAVLTCLPDSLCSWDYRIRGGESGQATITFNFFTEQGTIFLAGATFSVRKHGWLSGHWTLERDGGVYAEASKYAMIRKFDVRAGAQVFVLKAELFTRRFEVLSGASVVGTIRPAHMFTRRAFVDCDESVPELVQLFAFWLIVLTWRRAAKNNHAAPG